MSWNYENYLEQQLNSLAEGFSFKVEPERMFLESGVDIDKCYVSVKYLSSEVEFGFIKRQPVNIIILGLPSDKKIEEINNVINEFISINNYTQKTFDATIIKQEYTSPVVLDGFMEVANTKRPVTYLSGTLYIMENVGDLTTLSIDSMSITPLNFNFNYVMQPNTQPNSQEYLAISMKNSASLSITMSLPMVNDYQTLINKVLGVCNGTTSGNSEFNFIFSVNDISFGTTQSPITMKLTSCQFTTAPNNVPALSLGFMR